MKLIQIECHICGAASPVQDILIEEHLVALCAQCWESMLLREGE